MPRRVGESVLEGNGLLLLLRVCVLPPSNLLSRCALAERAPSRLNFRWLCFPFESIQRDRVGSSNGIQIGPSNGIQIGPSNATRVGSSNRTRVGSSNGIQIGPSNGARVGSSNGTRVGSSNGIRVGPPNRIQFGDSNGIRFEPKVLLAYTSISLPGRPAPLIFKTTPSPNGLGISSERASSEHFTSKQ